MANAGFDELYVSCNETETLAYPPGTVIWVKVRLLARTWEVVKAVALDWLH